MLAVMAILPRNEAEAEVFKEEIDRMPLYERAVRLLGGISGCGAMLATNLPEAAALCAGLGVERIELDGWQQDSPPYLASLAAFLKGRDASAAQAAVILDPRYCFLGPELVESALARFRDSQPLVLASAGPAKDNPAQVMHGLSILHAGQIAFLEDPAASAFDWLHDFNAAQAQAGNHAPYLPTRPFPFPWASQSPATTDASPLAALCHLAYSPSQSYCLANTAALALPYYQESVILGYYYRESPGLARRLLSTYWLQKRLPRNIIGISPFGSEFNPGPFCTQYDGTSLLCLPGGKPASGAMLRIWPQRDGAILSGEAISVDISGKETLPYPLTASPSFPVCMLPGDAARRWHGFSFALLSHETDEPDLFELLPLHDAPYSYDRERKAVVNASGETITGRQQLPPVYTLNSAFTIFRPLDAGPALETLARGEAAAFPIPEKESLAVEDIFDVEVARSIL